MILFIEFDDNSDRAQKKIAKKAEKILKNHHIKYRIETEEEKREELWRIRHSVATLIAHSEGSKKAIPIVEDGIVPVDQLQNYIQGIYALFKKHGLNAAVWGHVGNANLRVQPFLDLAQIGDRQKVFRLIDEYYNMVIELGGSTSGEHNDGRLRGPYLPKLYGPEAYELFSKVKNIFDPHGILNPGVKVGVNLDDIKPLLRREYTMDHLFDYMPRS